MAEYIVEVNQDNSIDLPIAVRDKLVLEPGDKMVIRLDNAGEHMIMGKLPMDSMQKAPEIEHSLGQKVNISK